MGQLREDGLWLLGKGLIMYVTYYRVSTQRQGQSGLGLEAQRSAVQAYLAGKEIIAEFTEVESGRKTDRPQLAAALALAKKQKATLVIAKLDRLARNVHFISGLLESNVQFVAADMPEADRTFLQMAAVFAEWEAKKISERTKSAQAQFARLFMELVSLCFEIDEVVFGSMTKSIKGTDDGTPYNMKYVPSRDIKGEYGVDVRYGIMSGMDPNRAIIALLQMRSDKLVSRDYVRREIPMDLNVTQEEQRVDIEEMRDALRVSVAQYAQAIPALAAQGQDPSLIVSRIAEVIKGRQKGLSLETVVEKAFAPEPPPPAIFLYPPLIVDVLPDTTFKIPPPIVEYIPLEVFVYPPLTVVFELFDMLPRPPPINEN